ncbi:MAG: hypothetical protein LUD72_07005 [Bacteroidales bacterium]|nr:hypothetical protein [Bacteroidales bacterium]
MKTAIILEAIGGTITWLSVRSSCLWGIAIGCGLLFAGWIAIERKEENA